MFFHVFKRSFYVKQQKQPKLWKLKEIKHEIINLLKLERISTEQQISIKNQQISIKNQSNQIHLDQTLSNDFNLSLNYRRGFQFNLQEIFDIKLAGDQLLIRDLKSGREAVDWVSFKLEEIGRFDFE